MAERDKHIPEDNWRSIQQQIDGNYHILLKLNYMNIYIPLYKLQYRKKNITKFLENITSMMLLKYLLIGLFTTKLIAK